MGKVYEPKDDLDFEKRSERLYPRPTWIQDMYLRWQSVAMFGYIPQPPSEPEIICPCCKGSGQYHGLNIVEPCQECKGTGKIKGVAPNKPDEDEPYKIDYGALGLMRQDREFG